MVCVKICGITRAEDALLAASLGADAVGFVFADSPRKMTPQKAANIIDELPPFVKTVGLFVDESAERVENVIKNCRLDALQFHGDETPDYCKRFYGNKKIVKAFRMEGEETLSRLAAYRDVDAYLLDAYSPEKKGGTGKTFNWELVVEAKKFNKPIILAGGLTVDNVKEAVEIARPYAVDVSSGVESAPGKKDPRLLKEFITELKGHNT